MQRIETPRLILRSWQDGDAVPLAKAINDFRIARTTARIPWPYTLDDALVFQRQLACAAPPSRFLVMTEKISGNQPIGGIGLDADDTGAAAEIGYWLAVPWWGRGLGYEAAAALCNWAFTGRGCDRLYARYRHGNEASRRILDRLGFRLIGHAMAPSRAEARLTPTACLELTWREWRRSPPLRTRG